MSVSYFANLTKYWFYRYTCCGNFIQYKILWNKTPIWNLYDNVSKFNFEWVFWTPCIGCGAINVQLMSAFTNTSLPLSTSTSLLLHTNIRATYLLHSHLLKYDCNFAGEGGHSLLWLEATTFLNYIDIYLIDHLLKYGWKFAGGGGNSLL